MQNATRTIQFNMSGTLEGVGLPGSHADVMLSPQGRPSKGPYTIVFTLEAPGKAPRPPEELSGHDDLVGDSQIAFALPGDDYDDEVVLNVALEGGGEQIVRAYPNEFGRLAKLKVEHVFGASYEEARSRAARIVFDLLSNLSFMYDVPMEIFQTDVIDEQLGNFHITLRFAYSTGVWNAPMERGGEVQKYAAMYREGMASRSDFYSFLCYYKIIEAVDANERADAAKAAKEGATPKAVDRHELPTTDEDVRRWATPIFPAWYVWNKFEIGNVAPIEARGKRLAAVRHHHLSSLRHEVAHGLLDDIGIIDMDDPELHKQVKYWLPYVRMMARRVVFTRCYPQLATVAEADPAEPN